MAVDRSDNWHHIYAACDLLPRAQHDANVPAGYLLAMGTRASNNLIENNILLNGNKVDIMQATGGGNMPNLMYLISTPAFLAR
jgi:hypothetical protein